MYDYFTLYSMKPEGVFFFSRIDAKHVQNENYGGYMTLGSGLYGDLTGTGGSPRYASRCCPQSLATLNRYWPPPLVIQNSTSYN